MRVLPVSLPAFPELLHPLAVSSPPPSGGVRPAPGGRAALRYALRWGTLTRLPHRAGRTGSAVGAAWPPAGGAGGHTPELAAHKSFCISYPQFATLEHHPRLVAV